MSTTTIVLGVVGLVFSLVAWASFGTGVWEMIRVIRVGQPDSSRLRPFFPRFKQLLIEFLAHTKMVKFRSVGWAHWLVMIGFLGGMLLYFEAYGQTFNPAFHWPVFGNWFVWHLWDELLGIGTVVGIVALIVIRQRNNPNRLGRKSRFFGSYFPAAYLIEMIVLLEGLGMVLVKAGKIATYGHADPYSDFFTMQIARILPESVLLVAIFAFVKMISGGLFLLLVGRKLTWGVAWHRFAAFFNIYFKREVGPRPALGPLKPMMSGGRVLEMDTADPETDTFGVGKIEDFTWKDLLDVTTCTECGRCQSQCPAWNTGKPLSPKLLIMSLRSHLYAEAPYLLAGGRRDAGEEVGLSPEALAQVPEAARTEAQRPLVGDAEVNGVIDPDVLWSCTTCGACVEQCPVDIEHIDHIVDMRRYQVMLETEFPGELGVLFKNLENKGNPWGQNAKDRTNWIDEVDFDVPVYGQDVESFDGFEYLFWVGCAGAYEDRAKKTTKAVAELLATAGVKFLVLGSGETCTGDSARRAGNEFLFQQLAAQNVETLDGMFSGVERVDRKVVVTCPHCFNTLGREYPQLGGNYTVLHHTQLLNRLIRDKKLVPVKPVHGGGEVTYHDPCYLGRHNKVYDPPRELIAASGAELTEMPRHGDRSLCCGAGGARMWMEERIGKRVNHERVEEALNTGAGTIATGCPFCRVMVTDGVNDRAEAMGKDKAEVLDVAQLLLASLDRDAVTLPAKGSAALAAERAVAAAAAEVAAEAAVAEVVAEAADAAVEETSPIAPSPTAAAKPVTGLGLAGGAKRPGTKKAAPAAAAPASAPPASAAPAPAPAPGKGLGVAAGAKRPGAKKAATAATGTPPATAPPAEAPATTPTKGLGLAAGAKRPGAKKTAPTTPTPAAATAAPAATPAPAPDKPEPPVKGLGLAAGAKRPGAKKAAPTAVTPSAPAAQSAPAQSAPAPAAAPQPAPEAARPEPAVKGLAIATGARRPGAKKAAPRAEPVAAAEPAPTPPAEPAPTVTASTPPADPTPEPPVKGLPLARGARRPGRKQ